MRKAVVLLLVVGLLILGMRACARKYYDDKLKDMNNGFAGVVVIPSTNGQQDLGVSLSLVRHVDGIAGTPYSGLSTKEDL